MKHHFRLWILAALLPAMLWIGGCATYDKIKEGVEKAGPVIEDVIVKYHAALDLIETLRGQNAELQKKLDDVQAKFTALGAPVGQGVAALSKWGIEHPEHVGSEFLLLIGAEIMRRKKNAAAATAAAATAHLDTVAHNLGTMGSEVQTAVLRGTPLAAGSGIQT